MRSYGHIIYAGGANGITLQGTPYEYNGYQIVDVSRNMTDGSIVYDAGIVNCVINFGCPMEKDKRADSECYAYCVPDVGASFLVRLAQRGLDQLEGIDSLDVRRRTTVSETIVDLCDVYPCQMIGSPVFSALNVDPREYYRDQSPKPTENIEGAQASMGPITREEALRFAQLHEQDVRKLAYYLLDQLSRAPEERRAVAIRDSESNVRLWIAAATYALPLCAALQVSFNTNVQDISTQAKQLVYGVQKANGKYTNDFSIQNPNQAQRLFAMIIGVGSAEETQVIQKRPNKPFIAMSEINAPGINASYFSDMVVHDEKIQSFNACIRDLQNCPCNLRLAQVYEAYCTLSAKTYESYDAICDALDIMMPLFTEKSYLQCYVVDQITRGMLSGVKAMGMDHLLCKLIPVLSCVQTVDVRERFEEALVLYLGAVLERFKGLEGCARIAEVVSSTPKIAKRVLIPVMSRVLGEAAFDDRICAAEEKDLSHFLKILECYRRTVGEQWIDILSRENPRMTAVTRRVANSDGLTDEFMTLLENDTQAMDRFVVEAIQVIGIDRNRRVKWWLSMLTRGIPLDRLCALIARSDKKEGIEAVLCVQIRQHGHSREIHELYSKYLSSSPDAGRDYYAEWIRSLSKDADRFRGIKEILTSLGSNSAQAELCKNTLRTLDKEIEYTDTRENEQMADLIGQFASRARVYCPRAEAFTYVKSMTSKGGSLFKSKRTNSADTYLKHNAYGQVFEVKSGFASSRMCKDFISSLLESPEEPSVYIILAASFRFDAEREEEAYFTAAAEAICALFLRRKFMSLATLIYTVDCIGEGVALREDASKRIIEKLDMQWLLVGLRRLLDTCEIVLQDEKTDSIADKAVAEASKQFGSRTEKRLRQILNTASERYQKTHKGGLLGKFFGKW